MSLSARATEPFARTAVDCLLQSLCPPARHGVTPLAARGSTVQLARGASRGVRCDWRERCGSSSRVGHPRTVETVANAERERGHNAATAFPVYLDAALYHLTISASKGPKRYFLFSSSLSRSNVARCSPLCGATKIDKRAKDGSLWCSIVIGMVITIEHPQNHDTVHRARTRHEVCGDVAVGQSSDIAHIKWSRVVRAHGFQVFLALSGRSRRQEKRQENSQEQNARQSPHHVTPVASTPSVVDPTPRPKFAGPLRMLRRQLVAGHPLHVRLLAKTA
jgi:hypothetical protein